MYDLKMEAPIIKLSKFSKICKLTPRDVKKSMPRATWYMNDVKSPDVRVFDLPWVFP
jgi:hypothetical protein